MWVRLCALVEEFNTVYAPVMMCMLSVSIVSSIACLYVGINSLILSLGANFSVMYLFISFISLLVLFDICNIADSVIKKVSTMHLGSIRIYSLLGKEHNLIPFCVGFLWLSKSTLKRKHYDCKRDSIRISKHNLM